MDSNVKYSDLGNADQLEYLETPIVLFVDKRFSGLSKSAILIFSFLLWQTKKTGSNRLVFDRNEALTNLGISDHCVWYRYLPQLKDVGLVSSQKKNRHDNLLIVDVYPEKLYGYDV